MDGKSSVIERILGVINQNPWCSLEDVMRACEDLSWSQVFLEVDRLSRAGEIRLVLDGPGVYRARRTNGHRTLALR
ncbi:MAG: hypothetical protein AB1411_14915 [Nitrospirota bacterium]